MEPPHLGPSLSTSEVTEQNRNDSNTLANNIITISSPNITEDMPASHTLSQQLEQAWNTAIDARDSPAHSLDTPDLSDSNDRQGYQGQETQDPDLADTAHSASPPDTSARLSMHGLFSSVESLLYLCMDALTSSFSSNSPEMHLADQDDHTSENATSTDIANPAPMDHQVLHTSATTSPETNNPSIPANPSDMDNADSYQSTPQDASSSHPPPSFLMYVPQDISPFLFGFLYDASSSMAWPILDQFERPEFDDVNLSHRTIHILGRPFRLTVTINPVGAFEEADVDKLRTYLKGLEVVDAELRAQMSRLGMSDISEYDDTAENQSNQSVTGCCICLEPYPEEDKSSLLDDEEQGLMERIIALPCPGFHTMHASCLFHWLKSKPPSKWTCPYCRTQLDPDHPMKEASDATNKPQTLRELVRIESRRFGCKCDAPDCPWHDETDAQASRMVQLLPCRHQIHLGCLCTCTQTTQTSTMYYEDDDTDEEEEESESDFENSYATSRMAHSEYISPSKENLPLKQDTIGKWVSCAACRKTAWAQVPTFRRPRPRSDMYAHLSRSTEL